MTEQLLAMSDDHLVALVRAKSDATNLEKELAQRLSGKNEHIDKLEDKIEDLEDEITALENNA